MPRTVLLDCDGPLACFTEAYLGAFTRETGLQASTNDVDRWDIHECAFFARGANKLGITTAKLRARVDAHVKVRGFCSDIRPQPGAKDIVAAISSMAAVYVVTSPWYSSPTWMYERTQWLYDHFRIPARNVIHTSAKYMVPGDVLVDDRGSHVREWADAWPKGLGILFDMHHNQEEPNGLRAIRGGWDSVLSFLQTGRV